MTFLIHFLQKILNLQMHRLLVHLDTCIYFCCFLARAWLSIHTTIICLNN